MGDIIDIYEVGRHMAHDGYVLPRQMADFRTASSSEARVPQLLARRDMLGLLQSETILIVDDCTLHRENLSTALTLTGVKTPAAAWDLRSLVTAVDEMKPDILLLNVTTRDCVALLKSATDIVPRLRTIVMGVSEEDEAQIIACAEVGVADYHMRSDSFDDLLRTIQRVADGETACTPAVSAMLLRRLSALAAGGLSSANEPALTTRETQILKMLELGSSNQQIADQLAITIHTVKNHVHSLLTKLGVGTRAEAAAMSRGLRRRQP
ncbi:response regulator transcription factor [Mycobacterium sp. AMU20-3851]|uniref:LuxR C-terminal-related transcriptional regulator n=1 Tax=Mycobacterium sp. AMU20-3851 TaxID=3122055 RepID=UPI003754B12A